MKKLLTIMLATMFLLLAACQATPEVEIVVQKDMEQMLEKAEATEPIDDEPVTLPLRERLGAPERYAVSIEKDKLTVSVDAEVELPEVTNIPVVRVRARDFTQDEVYHFFSLFCGDTPMYLVQDVLTKAQIEELIVTIRRDAVELRASGDEDDLSTAEYYESISIPALEKLYEIAPQAVDINVTDGTLMSMELNDQDGRLVGTYMGLSAQERLPDNLSKGSGKRFYVKNNDDMDISAYFKNNSDCLVGVSKTTGAVMLCRFARAEEIYHEAPVPIDAAKKAGVSPEAAIATASAFLADNKLPFAVDGMSFYDIDATPYSNGYYCYIVRCVRIVEGIRCAAASGASNIGEGAMAESWSYEMLSLCVDGQGISSMSWDSPLELVDTIVESSTLLSFADVANIFENMMPVRYEPEAREEIFKHTTYNINRVALELVRVIEQNSIESGLLVPAWCFYGTMDRKYADGVIGDDPSFLSECLLTLNAIDGSVIDPQKGY